MITMPRAFFDSSLLSLFTGEGVEGDVFNDPGFAVGVNMDIILFSGGIENGNLTPREEIRAAPVRDVIGDDSDGRIHGFEERLYQGVFSVMRIADDIRAEIRGRNAVQDFGLSAGIPRKTWSLVVSTTSQADFGSRWLSA